MHKSIKHSLIILGSLFGLAIIVLALGFGYLYSAKQLTITELDRELIVGPVELEAFDDEFKAQPESIKLNKVRYIDGAVELTMEYNPDDTDQPYMSVVISTSPKKTDALANYHLSWNTQAMVFNANDSGYEFMEDNKILSAGEQSRFASITYENNNVGNILVVMQDKIVYEFILTGLYIEDKDILEELFTERLKKLAQFGSETEQMHH